MEPCYRHYSKKRWKGIGVNKVLEYYGIDKSQAMAFGDGNNDIEMFEQVGHPIAMGNASDNLLFL